MELEFSREQKLMRQSIAEMIAKECPADRVREIEETESGYDPVVWGKMADLGYLGVVFPEKYEGYGGQFIEAVILLEEMGKAVFPSPFFTTVIQCGLLVLDTGTEKQKKEILGKIADGKMIISLAQHEEDGSYFPSDIRMTAVFKDNSWLLSGKKMFVINANIADKFIVAAKAIPEGLTLFVVDANHPQIVINKIPTIGPENNYEVIFNEACVNENSILGAPGRGEHALEPLNAKSAVAKASEMVGGCWACIKKTASYAKQRKQYGKPIGSFQVIQHYMANMLLEYDTIENYLYFIASLIDGGKAYLKDSYALKACVNEAYKFISERAIQIHGAFGTTFEGEMGRYYRKAKGDEYIIADSDHCHERVFSELIRSN